MTNADQQLNHLRRQLDQLDTTAVHQRIEANLQSAWQQTNSINTIMETTPQPKQRNWRIFNYALSGSGLVVLALITTVIMQPSGEIAPTSTRQEKVALNSPTTSPKNEGLYFDSSATLGASDSFDATGLTVDELEPMFYDDEYNDQDLTYEETDKTKQLFSESVSLSIEVATDPLQVIHSLRKQVTAMNGYLVNISYVTTGGTLNIKLPADQLTAFEDELKTLDANQEVEVTQYNVTNVSAEVVEMDEYIKISEDQVKELEDIIASNASTDSERSDAKEQLEITRNIIEESKILRDEAIAKYNLVNVTVNITEYQSFWEGNYNQYDRSTISGQIQYELGKTMYTLIRSTGKITNFIIWLGVYSVILIPVFLLIRFVVRKIIRSVRNQYPQ